MKSQTIYKRDSAGNVRAWNYEVEGDSWRTHHGVLGGAMVESGWTACTPKSQATGAQQAAFEAEAEMTKKLALDYHADILDIDRLRASTVKPMLAQKYESWDHIVVPVWTQPKLDGVRCIANRDGLWSRQGKQFFGVPHILAALDPLFQEHPDAVLDGELYNHDLHDDFNSIVSMVKKQTPTVEQLKASERLIQYHVYDAPSVAGSFDDRYNFLNENLPWEQRAALQLVETAVAATPVGLDYYYEKFLGTGYEGQMIRLPGTYEQKRSKLLLKRKEFQDQEFPVEAIEEGLGNWAGYAKKATLRLPDGRTFGAGIKGTQAYCKALLGTKPQSATIRFFALTPDGVPRFPIAVAFHEGERV
jgi:DNA ligase-1